jgi:TatD DNase family protein
MLVDTHCHLDFEDFARDRDEVLGRAKSEGIGFIINVGSSLKGTERAIEIARQNDFVYAAAGIHPHEADRIADRDIELFERYSNSPKIVAIGEIGLDYYKNISSKDNQKRLFIRLLELAKRKGLSVIIHNRDAHKDVVSILKEVMGESIKGVMHCFSGDENVLKECLDLGMFVSFTCNLTFKNAQRLREIAKKVPLDRLLLETDAPFLAPQIFRGRRNEPAYVKYLAEEIAKIKGLGFEEVARVTTDNAKRLFGIKV